ncbi:MAG: GNAT family N-acetyltransferase [Anaerolineales bacterium]
MIDMPEYQILVNDDELRIETTVNGLLSKIDYQVDGDRIYYYHTEVPPELGGRGIASRMARFALEYARQQGLGVVPLCPFVAAYIERNPEYQSLVVPAD